MKSQISINFTWIFALFAGIAIFIFLMNLTDSEQRSSRASTSFAVLEKLDLGLEAVSNTPNTFTQIDTPKINLKVICDDMESSGLALEGAPRVNPKANEVIFSPESLSSNSFFAWTQDWNSPFRIERFLYLSNKDVVFVIVRDDQSLWSQFLKLLPKEFPRIVTNLTSARVLVNQGYDEYRVVFFDRTKEEVTGVRWNLEGDVKGISIIPTGDLFTNGGIGFYNLDDGVFEHVNDSHYIGSALMYGAVFSGTHTHYNCNLDKAFLRLKMLTELNMKRSREIMIGLAGNRQECQEIVNGHLLENTDTCNECLRLMWELPNLYNTILTSINNGDYNEIGEASSEIDQISKDLAKGRNCPTL